MKRVIGLDRVVAGAMLTLVLGCGDGNPARELAEGTRVYLTGLPAASGPGRVVTLTLYPGGDALLVEKFIDRDPPGGFLRPATWTEGKDGIDLHLTDEEGEVLSFRRRGNRLDYSGDAYGAGGLPLERVH